MATTTSYGTWYNHTGSNLTVEADVADFIGGGPSEWVAQCEATGALEKMVDAYRAAINTALPEGVSLAGDEFYGPEYEEDYAWEGELDIAEIIQGIDLGDIVDEHDPDMNEDNEDEDTEETKPVVAGDHTDVAVTENDEEGDMTSTPVMESVETTPTILELLVEEGIIEIRPKGRYPKLLVSPDEMEQHQWEEVRDTDFHVYACVAYDPAGRPVARWLGSAGCFGGGREAAEDYLTRDGGRREHTVVVWESEDRSDTDRVDWSQDLQDSADEAARKEAAFAVRQRARMRRGTGVANVRTQAEREELRKEELADYARWSSLAFNETDDADVRVAENEERA